MVASSGLTRFSISEERTYPFRYREVNVQWAARQNAFINSQTLYGGATTESKSIELNHAEARRVRDALTVYLEDH